ncbi:hypothetical protein AAZX31_20G100100 [Glycine max]
MDIPESACDRTPGAHLELEASNPEFFNGREIMLLCETSKH